MPSKNRKSAKAYAGSGIPVPSRPWFALTESQREARLDTVAWHEGHDIFLAELLDHPIRRVRSQASSTNEQTFKLMIRAYKQNLDLAQLPVARLMETPVENWGGLPKAPVSYTREPKSKKELRDEARAAGKKASQAPVQTTAKAKAPKKAPAEKLDPLGMPALGGKFPDLTKTLDDIVKKAIEPGRKFKTIKPPAWATNPDPMPWAEDTPQDALEQGTEPRQEAAGDTALHRRSDPKMNAARQAKAASINARDNPNAEVPRTEPKMEALHHAAKRTAAEAFGLGAIPEPEGLYGRNDQANGGEGGGENPSKADLAEIQLIRDKLVVNGRVRLDIEALSVFILVPSYFAIATGLDPEPWQSKFLDSYAQRLGCLASRQCGKSIITARKVCCYAMTNPGTTTLILAPTLRQSTELLLKIGGVSQLAGLKIASWSQFQIVFSDKQPGAASRIVCLPGSNEDSGASTRGYASDLLVLEEAAFLNESVISSVLPSIAARPKAQLIGISSAGIIGSYFHSVMTSPQSRWQKMTIPAAESGRFTKAQLDELKLTLGARYAVEMECRWGSVGDSIYTDDAFEAAFGTESLDPEIAKEIDSDAAYADWLDLEQIFAATPFPRKAA